MRILEARHVQPLPGQALRVPPARNLRDMLRNETTRRLIIRIRATDLVDMRAINAPVAQRKRQWRALQSVKSDVKAKSICVLFSVQAIISLLLVIVSH